MTYDDIELAALFPNGIAGAHIHAIGTGGSGISAVLWLARDRGALVSGCDIAPTAMWKLLQREGLDVALGHDTAHLEGADLVVVSPFLVYRHPDLPELVAARARRIPVVKWQALLGYLMRGSVGVSVAGVHGKGSVTALLGQLAIAARLDPICEVGASAIAWDRNVWLGHGRYFINEADEWDYNFLHYHPRIVVLNAVEFDHPEFFASYEQIRDAFVTFIRGMEQGERAAAPPPTLVLNSDNLGCLDVLERLGDWSGVVRTFAIARADADVGAEDIQGGQENSFTLRVDGERLGRVRLHTPGMHNVYNALAAVAGAGVIGVPPDLYVPELSAWPGLRRRFEVIEDGDALFIDDYAHHPHAVALTLETARARYPGRRVVAVFQPTLYTRLLRFLQPFSEAFDRADEVVIAEIQPSRETDTGLIHGSALVERIAARPAFADRPGSVRYGGTYEETAVLLRALRQPGDVIVVMGSGPVNQVIAGARMGQASEVS